MEQWKDIPGFEGYYQASTMGRIRSVDREIITSNGYCRSYKGKVISKKPSANGYRYVGLKKDGYRTNLLVHQVIVKTFYGEVGIEKGRIVIDHINNIKTDNRLENLQVISHRENCNKDRNGYSSKYRGVSFYERKKRYNAFISINSNLINIGGSKSEIEAAKLYKIAVKNQHLYEGCNKSFREKIKALVK